MNNKENPSTNARLRTVNLPEYSSSIMIWLDAFTSKAARQHAGVYNPD